MKFDEERLETALPHWHTTAYHKRTLQRCWSMEKAVKCEHKKVKVIFLNIF